MAQKEIKRRSPLERDRDPRAARRPSGAPEGVDTARGAAQRDPEVAAAARPRVAGQDLTTANKIMVAAAKLDEDHETFTAEDLIVVAWQLFPESFGLTGYREIYPDSNRVLSKLMGSVGLCSRGWLEQVSTKTYKMTASGRKLVLTLRANIAQSAAAAAAAKAAGHVVDEPRVARPMRRSEPALRGGDVAPVRTSRVRDDAARTEIAPPARVEAPTPVPIARPERAVASDVRARPREEPPAPVAISAAPVAAKPRTAEPAAPVRAIAPPVATPARPAGSGFDGLPALQRLALSAASQKFSRGGLVTFADACQFWAINPGVSAAMLQPRLSDIESLLKRAEMQIQSAGAPIRVHDRLEVSLTTVIGLQGLHRMLMQKYNRELANIRARDEQDDEN